MPHTLVIRQIDGSDPPRFEVARVRGADVKVAEAVEVPPPDTLAVDGLPDGSFPRELRWYLERFLDYPFSPDTERAEGRDFDAAERWCLKSLAIKENQGDEHEAASTYAHLGVLAALRARYVDAGRWMIRSTRSFLATNDRHQADRSTANFRLLLRRAMPADQATIRALWREAGLPEIPLDNGVSR